MALQIDETGGTRGGRAHALAAAPARLGCMPGCSGYHLTFTGPLGANGSALATADRDVTVTWDDSVDGASATFDILMSREPVPAYPMHSFPTQLPGEVLALGLSATAQSSWTWDTSQVEPGTVFLYAVFHNSPFNTLVMPFAAATISHDSAASSAPAILIRSPRGTSAVGGVVSISLDAAQPWGELSGHERRSLRGEPTRRCGWHTHRKRVGGRRGSNRAVGLELGHPGQLRVQGGATGPRRKCSCERSFSRHRRGRPNRARPPAAVRPARARSCSGGLDAADRSPSAPQAKSTKAFPRR